MLSVALLFALKFASPAPDIKYQQPQVASLGDQIGLTFATGDQIFYAWSANDGQTFSRPSMLPVAGKLSLGRHRGPRIAYQSGNVLISAVVGAKGKGEDGDILVWTSDDNGKSWNKPVKVNDVPGAAREGLHSMASGNGWVVVVWLDLRDKGTRLYGAKSSDGGATWSKNFLVYESADGSICQCCHPTVLVGPGGAIHVMFRNALNESRDMYWIRSENGGLKWEPARKLGLDTWKLNACPMDGGSFAISGDNVMYSVWRRDKKIYITRPDGKESELGEGKDPVIASALNQDLYAVWTGTGGSLQTRSRRDNTVRTVAPSGAYPQVVFTGRSVLTFFEQNNGIAMEILESRDSRTSTGSR
jgi:hypothetical protein